jgi:hypothetical protein
VQTLAFASYLAHLDPLSGQGLLVRPLPGDDVPGPLGGPSLHEVEWSEVVRHLAALGWEPTEGDEPDGTCRAGFTRDGRKVCGLYAHEALTGLPSIREQAAGRRGYGKACRPSLRVLVRSPGSVGVTCHSAQQQTDRLPLGPLRRTRRTRTGVAPCTTRSRPLVEAAPTFTRQEHMTPPGTPGQRPRHPH